MEEFKTKQKNRTIKIRVIRAEHSKDSTICYKNSNDKSTGWNDLITGDKAIKRFIDWLRTQ